MFFGIRKILTLAPAITVPVIAKMVHPSAFAASKAVDVAAISSASEKVRQVPAHATYPMSIKDFKDKSTIHSDWASFAEGAAFVFKADMDTDCDGVNYRCDGNADGRPLTNWGALSAFEVPYIVIPQAFLEANPTAIPGQNVAAVICNNKMFYAVLGDTNGNKPQVTGEASWLLARSCFPENNLNGNRGHDEADVIYILFTGPEAVFPPSAINEHYITDFDKLRSMGNRLTASLMKNLGIKPLGASGWSPPKDDHLHDGNHDDIPTLPDVPQENGDVANDNQGSADTGSDDNDDIDSAASGGATPEILALFVAVLVMVIYV
ncbi:glycoside hydrolase family 75 protein [Aspergillus foveolatus]|uniref:glycoside hydrolase family 75 protein n=1 Tax=Aspergillus foveolatus TaxID=210207 RepID=UPI003CCD1AC0